ncbi:MAG: hypothetical protein ABR529_07515 [Actinomycetota bacterium]
MTDEQRNRGVVIDLDRLEAQAKDLFLHRFVSAIQDARGQHGRFLVLRAGDELAIKAAGDGSDGSLADIEITDVARHA